MFSNQELSGGWRFRRTSTIGYRSGKAFLQIDYADDVFPRDGAEGAAINTPSAVVTQNEVVVARYHGRFAEGRIAIGTHGSRRVRLEQAAAIHECLLVLHDDGLARQPDDAF